ALLGSPDRSSRDTSHAVQSQRVLPVEPRASAGREIGRVLAKLRDDARIPGVAVWEVRCPDHALRPNEWHECTHRPLAGVERDPALAEKVLGRLHREPEELPAVTFGELVQAIHPVCDPAAATLEDPNAEPRVALEHARVHEIRERHVLIEEEDDG